MHDDSSSDKLTHDTAEQFVITGEMHYAEEKLCISVQMLHKETHEEIWSQVMEYKLSKSNAFDIQNDIAKKLAAAVGDYCNMVRKRVGPETVMAVA
jgi:TolB-like protein